jgi:hypothetical protein
MLSGIDHLNMPRFRPKFSSPETPGHWSVRLEDRPLQTTGEFEFAMEHRLAETEETPTRGGSPIEIAPVADLH